MKTLLLPLLLLLSGNSYAEQPSFTGSAVDPQGNPLSGVIMTVRLGGSTLEAQLVSRAGQWIDDAIPALRSDSAYVFSCQLPNSGHESSCDIRGRLFLVDGLVHCEIDRDISRPDTAVIWANGGTSVSNWDGTGTYAIGSGGPTDECVRGTNLGQLNDDSPKWLFSWSWRQAQGDRYVSQVQAP